jgi:hypothetical protein
MNVASGVLGNENRGGRRSVGDAHPELAGRDQLLPDVIPMAAAPVLIESASISPKSEACTGVSSSWFHQM